MRFWIMTVMQRFIDRIEPNAANVKPNYVVACEGGEVEWINTSSMLHKRSDPWNGHVESGVKQRHKIQCMTCEKCFFCYEWHSIKIRIRCLGCSLYEDVPESMR